MTRRSRDAGGGSGGRRWLVLGLLLWLGPAVVQGQAPVPDEPSLPPTATSPAQVAPPAETELEPWRVARQDLERLGHSQTQRLLVARQRLDALQTRCQALRFTAVQELAKPPGETGRQEALDATFADLEACVGDLHQWLRERRRADSVTVATGAVAKHLERGRRGAAVAPSTGEGVDPWRDMQADLEASSQVWRQAEAKQLDDAVDLFLLVTRSRWQLAPKVSQRARALSAENLFTETQDEIELSPAVVRRRLERGYEASRRLPALWVELLALRLWLWEATLLVLVMLLWRNWRRRSQDIGQRVVRWMTKASHSREETPGTMALPLRTERLAESAAGVWTAVLDAVLLVLIYALLLNHFDGLGPWLWIALLGIAWRGLPSLAALTIASPVENRPAFMVGSRSVREHQVMTSRSIVGWALVSLLVLTTVRQGLVSYRLLEVTRLLARWSLLLLVIFLLDRWAPLLRRQMHRLGAKGWGRWLAEPARGRLGNIFKAACAAVYLLIRALVVVGSRFLGGNRDFSWWTLRLARSDLQEDQWVREPLSGEIRQRILESDAPRPRVDDLDWLQDSVTTWQGNQERNLAALIGYRGAGKSHLLDSIEQRVEAGDLAAGLRSFRWRLDQRPGGSEEALTWLLRRLEQDGEGGPSPSPDEIREDIPEEGSQDGPVALEERIRDHLAALPPTLFLVDDMHYLVLRAVGGFDAFEAVQRCMYESSTRHFWVVTFHQPAWSYLEAMAVEVNLDVFRTRLTLAPWKEEDLSSWLTQRTEQAGYETDFSRLVRRGPLDEESDVDLERAQQAYWQLLTSASSGNPEVATLYWLDSLCQESGDHHLAVTLFAEPSVATLSERGDTALFVLAALWMHGRLDVSHLADVLNMPINTIETTCRFLDSIDVVNEVPSLGFALEGRWRPPVERLLRQRNFVHLRG